MPFIVVLFLFSTLYKIFNIFEDEEKVEPKYAVSSILTICCLNNAKPLFVMPRPSNGVSFV